MTGHEDRDCGQVNEQGQERGLEQTAPKKRKYKKPAITMVSVNAEVKSLFEPLSKGDILLGMGACG